MLLLGILVSACSDSDEESDTRAITADAGPGGGGGAGGDGDGGRGGDGGRDGGVGEDDDLVTNGCEPRSCDSRGLDCGVAADGCGDVVDCGKCSEGELCGIVSHNTCTAPESLCAPFSKRVACDGKECGIVADGCGESYDCGACEEGYACGLAEAFQCAEVPTGGPGKCEAEVDSCAEAGADCGFVGNGCGDLIDCEAEAGACPEGEFCGLGGAQQCGAPPGCEPLSLAEACEGKCGRVGDGCGNVLDCATEEEYRCASGTACGAGGTPNACGSADEASCSPVSESDACDGRECGLVSDGCSETYKCGECTVGDVCQNGTCVPICTPVSESDACDGKECGRVGDGCGGSYDCGSCESGETCGIQAPFECDVTPPTTCQPLTEEVACEDKQCGVVFDGCGSSGEHRIDCAAVNGGCADGEFCGIAEAYQCNAPEPPTCDAASSCEELGWGCGVAVDACGNTFNCASEGLTCNPELERCIGGINGPAVCQRGGGGPDGECDVCDAIADCRSEEQPTTLTGRVITPGRNNGDTANQVGVPNAFVYILQNDDADALPAIGSGVPVGGTACDRCEDQDLGPVLASATTDARGEFTLVGNIPVGTDFVLVVKIGKWRRAQRFRVDSPCATTSIPTTATRLPRSSTDGLAVNIPRIAISTGEWDAMECVFHKMGVATSEFARPGAGGGAAARIHMYASDENPGAAMNVLGATTSDAELTGSTSRLFGYDMIVFDCEGERNEEAAATDARVREYVNRGGRMFVSHWSYVWVHDNGSLAYSPGQSAATGLAPAADFDFVGNDPLLLRSEGLGRISDERVDRNPAKMEVFVDWLLNEDAVSGGAGNYTFTIAEPRDLAVSVGDDSEEWIYYQSPVFNDTRVQQFSFNAPYGAPADAVCGRVAYSAFHVSGTGGGNGAAVFPNHCGGSINTQEKVLLYMLFDLGACVSDGGPPPPPDCVPPDEDELCPTGVCGRVPDGCGGTAECGACPSGQYCGANNTCIPAGCTKITCGAVGATCGVIADGCGGELDCGDCESGQECGILVPNQCTPTCTPTRKADACDELCGFVTDGCGGVHECGDCPNGLVCANNECIPGSCDRMDECPDAYECGLASDGCDGTLNCGDCVLPEVCGGGGQNNVCGRPSCDPLSCSDLSAECGWIGDGCGGAVDCGPCPQGQTCGIAGPNQCAGCDPQSCQDVGAECGSIGDGCGGSVECGACPDGLLCGAFEPNKCGDAPTCDPLSCEDVDAECGLIGDGCGEAVDCGPCPEGEVCGVKTPNQCDVPPACEPLECEEVGAECGQTGDGCGELIDCGPCPPGQACGVERPNKCASLG